MKKYTEERPWGGFEQFTHNMQCTVKLLNVKPGQKLSLQYHRNRDEFWRVVAGEGSFVIGDDLLEGKPGDEFFIKRGDKHRIMTADSHVQVLEVSFGEFDENDIVRLEDHYDRV